MRTAVPIPRESNLSVIYRVVTTTVDSAPSHVPSAVPKVHCMQLWPVHLSSYAYRRDAAGSWFNLAHALGLEPPPWVEMRLGRELRLCCMLCYPNLHKDPCGIQTFDFYFEDKRTGSNGEGNSNDVFLDPDAHEVGVEILPHLVIHEPAGQWHLSQACTDGRRGGGWGRAVGRKSSLERARLPRSQLSTRKMHSGGCCTRKTSA